MKNQLTNEIKIDISQELIKLCDRTTYIENELKAKYIAAFKLVQLFQGSFGDEQFHIKYTIETVKEKIGSYNGSFFDEDGERFSIYESEYIKSLLQKKEQVLGLSFTEYKKSRPPAWEYTLDDTSSNQTKMQYTNSAEFEVIKAEFDDKLRKCKEKERKANANNSLINDEEFRQLKGAPLLAGLLTEKLNKVGFALDNRFSGKTHPVFSKQINSKFYLCCTIKNIDETFIQPGRGIINLVFHVRNSKCRKAKVETSPHVKVIGCENFMVLFVNDIIPYFEYAYSFFESPEEFEQNIDAQITLFEVLFETIKDKVYATLGGVEL